MFKFLAGVAAGAVIAIANISTAAASPTASAMREGGYALAPFSFVKFCVDYPEDCPKSGGPGRIKLTSERMVELASVNRAVNNVIRPKADTSALRYWKLNVDEGDCNNFAVQKRHELIQRGWPAAALALTVAKTSWGEGHLVVTVRTDKGDLVLDNLRANIVSWQRTGYDWIMRQSERNPQFWVDLHGGEAAPVYAAADLDDTADVETAEGVAAGPEPIGAKPVDNQPIVAEPVRAGRQQKATAAELTQADAPRSPDLASLEADEAKVALADDQTKAFEAAMGDLTHWIADERRAALPVLDEAVALLDRGSEPSPASAATQTGGAKRRASVVDPIDPPLFGFL